MILIQAQWHTITIYICKMNFIDKDAIPALSNVSLFTRSLIEMCNCSFPLQTTIWFEFGIFTINLQQHAIFFTNQHDVYSFCVTRTRKMAHDKKCDSQKQHKHQFDGAIGKCFINWIIIVITVSLLNLSSWKKKLEPKDWTVEVVKSCKVSNYVYAHQMEWSIDRCVNA